MRHVAIPEQEVGQGDSLRLQCHPRHEIAVARLPRGRVMADDEAPARQPDLHRQAVGGALLRDEAILNEALPAVGDAIAQQHLAVAATSRHADMVRADIEVGARARMIAELEDRHEHGLAMEVEMTCTDRSLEDRRLVVRRQQMGHPEIIGEAAARPLRQGLQQIEKTLHLGPAAARP